MLYTVTRPDRLRNGFARFLKGLVLGLLLVPAVAAVPEEAATVTAAVGAQVEEYWYRIDVGETPAGWMLDRRTRDGDLLTTESILNLRFKRGETQRTLELESRFVETLDGRPLSAWSKHKLGREPVETTWEFEGDTVLVSSPLGDTKVRRPAGDWLPPGRLQERIRELIDSGAPSFVVSTLDPQLGLEPVDSEWVLEARREKLQIRGQTLLTSRWRQRQSFAPQVETVSHVAEQGLVVRSVTPMMGLEMVLTLASRDAALADSGAPELLVRSFVYPDRPIDEPRAARRAVYEVYTEDGPLEALPSVGAQRVEGFESRARVVVEVGSSPLLEGENRPAGERYLRPSTTIDHTSPQVRRLLAAAAPVIIKRSGADAGSRAEALRAFVSGHLGEKNLDSILATASEAAESRSGDCTEHSVLLAALLRADGIPSRVVLGLVYVDEFAGQRRLFGYHMWTQALIENRWVDLDATLPVPFDAAHIAFSTTALSDETGTLGELAKLAALIGRVKIRVLEVER